MGQGERAQGAMLACRVLSRSLRSAPGQQGATCMLEKVGDQHSLHQCHQMIVKVGSGTAVTPT